MLGGCYVVWRLDSPANAVPGFDSRPAPVQHILFDIDDDDDEEEEEDEDEEDHKDDGEDEDDEDDEDENDDGDEFEDDGGRGW